MQPASTPRSPTSCSRAGSWLANSDTPLPGSPATSTDSPTPALPGSGPARRGDVPESTATSSPAVSAPAGERESYGYEVVQRLRELGLPDVAEGTVYPALSRLERETRLQSRLVASRSGPARKYYRPTAAGIAALTAGTASWLSLASVVTPALERRLPSTPVTTKDA